MSLNLNILNIVILYRYSIISFVKNPKFLLVVSADPQNWCVCVCVLVLVVEFISASCIWAIL